MNSTTKPIITNGDPVVVVQQPTDFPSLAWSMLDKVAQGSTAVIFALIIIWWFSRKAISDFLSRFNRLMDTLSQATRDNSTAQQELTRTQEHLNTTLQKMGEEDVKTAAKLGKIDSKLAFIRSLLLEVKSYQTGIPQNRFNSYLEADVLGDDDSDLGS